VLGICVVASADVIVTVGNVSATGAIITTVKTTMKHSRW